MIDITKYQQILYSLFNQKLLKESGFFYNHPNGVKEEVISKAVIVEQLAAILNDFGDILSEEEERVLKDETHTGKSQ